MDVYRGRQEDFSEGTKGNEKIVNQFLSLDPLGN